jgi:hypothetical protein
MFLITKFQDFINETEDKPLPADYELKADKNYVLMNSDKHDMIQAAKMRLWFNKQGIPYTKFVDNKYSGFELDTDDTTVLKTISDEVEANHKLFYTKYK